jgi:hypothetical protein
MRPLGAELFHADGRRDRRTDMTKLIVAFRNFANAPKNVARSFVKKYAASAVLYKRTIYRMVKIFLMIGSVLDRKEIKKYYILTELWCQKSSGHREMKLLKLCPYKIRACKNPFL